MDAIPFGMAEAVDTGTIGRVEGVSSDVVEGILSRYS